MCDPSLPDVKIRLHHPSPSGKTGGFVDPCIAPLVQALNDGGFQTAASCCGHGRQLAGDVLFEDGIPGLNAIMIFRTYEEWTESAAFLMGHCPLHVSLERWESFRQEFLARYEKAKELHAEEERLSRMA